MSYFVRLRQNSLRLAAGVNGEVVMRFPGTPEAPREEVSTRVWLKPGENKVLGKVACSGVRSVFSFRVTDLDGRSMPEVAYARLEEKVREAGAPGP